MATEYDSPPYEYDSDEYDSPPYGYDSDEYDKEKILEEVIKSDNRDEFVPMMTRQFRFESLNSYRVLRVALFVTDICEYGAVNCATALLQGETGKQLDLNAFYPFEDMTMLHEACHSPQLVELFLRYGARTDIKSKVTDFALEYMGGDHFWFTGWYPEQSIFTTIIVLCFPCLRSHLQAIRLLYRSTKEVEKEIFGFVREAKLIDMAIVLMAVGEEISSPTLFQGLCDSDLHGNISLRQSVLFEIAKTRNLQVRSSTPSVGSNNEHNKLVTLSTMLLLLDVFEKVGDEIEAFCLQYHEIDDKMVTNAQVAAKVGYLLNKAGLTYEDFPIKDVKRFRWGPSSWMSKFQEEHFTRIINKLREDRENRQLGSGSGKNHKESEAKQVHYLYNQHQKRTFASLAYMRGSPNCTMSLRNQLPASQQSLNHKDETRRGHQKKAIEDGFRFDVFPPIATKFTEIMKPLVPKFPKEKMLSNIKIYKRAETPENLEQHSGTWADLDLDRFLGESFRLSFNKILESICTQGWFWPLPPMLGDGKPVDLLKLFKIVMKKGGYDVVTKKGLWDLVAKESGSGSGLGSSVKLVYVKYLLLLETWLESIDDDSKQSKIESSNRLMELGAQLKGFLFESTNINEKERNSSLKRKRDSANWGMLNWVTEIGKDPCDPVIGSLPDKSRWKLSDGSEELWKQILQFREFAILKKYDHQKYQKMHPCIYDDDQTKFGYNLRKRQKQGNSSIDKHCGVHIGQAEVPEWTGVA
ncbi:hypothetical protein CCACVL1_10234 [Corchorus capsularis]|uniref:ARID domain-containing protein n=1 Tax=Corchorus capsularis TaxID=210143 RepID=A0A1R3IS13_COCAP|nr:hypothetical protein CCACVL1_10234 [Corchorus capsularis]